MVFPCFLSWLSLEICVNIADWWLYCLVPANYVNWHLLMERSFWSAQSIEGGILGCWLTLTWKGEALTSGSLGQIAKTLFKSPWGGVCVGGGLGLSNSTVIVSFPKTSIDAPPHCLFRASLHPASYFPGFTQLTHPPCLWKAWWIGLKQNHLVLKLKGSFLRLGTTWNHWRKSCANYV